jgi:DNA-binding CsgD family transcriptional regulator
MEGRRAFSDRGRAVLDITPGTVRKHLDDVHAKLGVRSRAQAVAVTADHR